MDGYHAHHFERLGWFNALNRAGLPVAYYDCKKESAFDVFDQLNPTVFIGQSYNLDRATIKCIKARPQMKVILRAGNFSSNEEMMNDPNVLCTTEQEYRILGSLLEEIDKPDLVYCHYLQEDMEITHDKFRTKLGIKILGVPMSADLDTYYNGSYNDLFESDIAFVGGYWPYKGQIIDQYLTPLCANYDYKIKIFGNRIWPHVNQFCGFIDDHHVKDLFASAKVCPNLSEPHSHTYGIDVNERAFKVLAAGGRCVMDNVAAAKKIFGNHVLFAENPKDFKEKVDNIIKNPYDTTESKQFVVNNHTNYHRVASMLENVGEHKKAKRVMDAHNNYIQ